jgi:nitrite reductase/ring-hydroxylating ferredoxin subunit
MTNRRRLGRLEEIPDHCARGFDPFGAGRDSLFVVRRGRQLFAYRDRCPHQSSTLAWRRHAYLNRAGDRIVCSGHAAEFDIESGRCLIGPCLDEALETVDLELTDEGEIYLQGPFRDEVRT